VIKGELVGGEALVMRFKALDPKLRTALTKAVTRLTMQLLRDVKENKLTGQALNTRSGRLRRSINAVVEGQGTLTVTGAVGTNLKYARAHEYGFQGSVTVREHLRTVKQVFGKPIGPIQVTVKSHAMRMNLPQRSFLRSALKELEPTIMKELTAAVSEVKL